MTRTILFVLSLLAAIFATFAALPSLVDKVHLERSLSLALGTDVELESVERFSLLPSPRIKTRGMRVVGNQDLELMAQQDLLQGFTPRMLGLSEAESITLGLSWKRFLTDGSLESFVLSGAKLAPLLDNDLLAPLVRQLSSRSQGAEIKVNDTEVAITRDGQELPPFHIESLTIETNDQGDRLVSGKIDVEVESQGQEPRSLTLDVTIALKPLRRLGESLIQSFDLEIKTAASEGLANIGVERIRANLIGSMQFEENKLPRLSATLAVHNDGALGEQVPLVQARLAWQNEALSLTEIQADIAGWRLNGNYWPASLPHEELKPGLHLVAADLPNLISDVADLPGHLQILRSDLDRAFGLLDLIGLRGLAVNLSLPRTGFGKLLLENLDLTIRQEGEGYRFDRLSFDSIAGGRFEATAGSLTDRLLLEGLFTCASPSVMLAELGLQNADLRQRSSLPELRALGRLSLAPGDMALSLERLSLAGDSFGLAVAKHGQEPWQFQAGDGVLNADYLNQDLAPTKGLGEDPMVWLARRLQGLPSFDARVSFGNLAVGSLPLGAVSGALSWRADTAALTLGEPETGANFRIQDLLGADIQARGLVQYGQAPTIAASGSDAIGQNATRKDSAGQTATELGITGLDRFELSLTANGERAFMPNRLMRDLGALMNSAGPLTLYTPAMALGLNKLLLTASSDDSSGSSTTVELRSSHLDGSVLAVNARLVPVTSLAAGAQIPQAAVWAVSRAEGLELDSILGADLARLIPLRMTSLTGRTNGDPGSGRYFLQLSSDAASTGGQALPSSVFVDTYPSLFGGAADQLAAIDRLDWIVDYDLKGLPMLAALDGQRLLDQPQQATLAIKGQLTVEQAAEGLVLSAGDVEMAGLRVRSLNLLLPRVGQARGNRVLSGDIAIEEIGLRANPLDGAGLAGGLLASLPLEILSNQSFTLNLVVDDITLGGLALRDLDLTLLSDGVTLTASRYAAQLASEQVTGQGRVSLGILPQLQLSAEVPRLRQSLIVKGTPIELESQVIADVTGLGSTLADMIANANIGIELNGRAAIRASLPALLLPDYGDRLARDLGEVKRDRLLQLFYDALANKTLPLTGRLRWIDGALRSSSGVQLGEDQDYLRISGRMSLADQELDLDLSLFGDDALIPAAALEMTGRTAAPRFQAFGSALD